MRKLLLKSFLMVVTFWWIAAFLVFSLADPGTNLAVLERLQSLAPFLTLNLPRQASALDALHLQFLALKYWTLPVLGLSALVAGMGVGLAALYTRFRIQQRHLREEPANRYWRDLGITLGELPIPPVLPSEETVLSGLPAEETNAPAPDESPATLNRLQALPAVHRELIDQIIGVLAAHPEAYVGPGHKTSLLEHSLNVLEVSLSRKESETEPLLPVAAIAHDLGKITAFEKQEDGSFKRVRWHDKESARILATLDGWWKLPEIERKSLLLALRYDHSSGNIPFLGKGVRERTLSLQNLLETSDRVATAEEKKVVLADLPLPDMVFEAFLKALPTFPLHVAGFAPAKNVKAAGWKKGDVLYLLENQCRERVLQVMDPDINAALGGLYRAQNTIAPFSQALFQALESRALLIREYNGQVVKAEEPMWNILSGTKEFKSVIMIRITEAMRLKLPETDTTYDITVTGSLRSSPPGEMAVASLDMAGLLRKPKKPRPPAEAPSTEEGEAVTFKGGYKVKPVDALEVPVTETDGTSAFVAKPPLIEPASEPTVANRSAVNVEPPEVVQPQLSSVEKPKEPDEASVPEVEADEAKTGSVSRKKRILKKPPARSVK